MLISAVVGYGYWGPNVARQFSTARTGAKLVAVSDLSEKRLGLAQNHYPFIKGMKDPWSSSGPRRKTPWPSSRPFSPITRWPKRRSSREAHLRREALTSTSAQARELNRRGGQEEPQDHGRPHLPLHRGGPRRSRNSSTKGELGKLLFYDSVRVNLGLFQHDVNVIWAWPPTTCPSWPRHRPRGLWPSRAMAPSTRGWL